MNASVIMDLYTRYEWDLKILWQLHELLSEYNLKELSNITSSVNPWLLFYHVTEKIINTRVVDLHFRVETENWQ